MPAAADDSAAARKLEAAALRERLRGLAPEAAQHLRRAMQLIGAGERLLAGQALLQATRLAPDHPEVQRWRGVRHAALGEWAEARDWLQRSAAQRPRDVATLMLLAQAQEHGGDSAAAAASLRAALQGATEAPQWQALSVALDALGHYDGALQAVEQVLRLHPDDALALLQRSRCLKALGQAQQAAADCRRLIAGGQETARAWFALLDLKTVALRDGELAQLEHAAARSGMSGEDRALLDFALGKALEDAGQYAAALASLQRANRAVQALQRWDRGAHRRLVAAVRQAFADAPLPLPDAEAEQGHEVIFLVGLPRSGTTLVEQVLASHSQVEGASELPYLAHVIDGESRRRGLAFPAWVATTPQHDWLRLGREYLQLSARWRSERPRATDKLPENWLYAGALHAMLPGARIIDCRRDALETCWSCYKQRFGPGRAGFAYDWADLASYWHDYDGLCRHWAARYASRFRSQSYEALVAAPEAQIRELLTFCGLPFEPGCLRFHEAQRAIRTPSALQVRQPMSRTSTPAAGYGALLDDLRERLATAALPQH